MQSATVADPLILLLIEATIALLLLVSLGLYRYSSGVRYKLWALGWTTYTTTSLISIIITATGLTLTDGIMASGMLVGSILFLDGAKEYHRKGTGLLIYILAVIIGFVVVLIGIVLGISYAIAFSILGVIVTYSCWYSAIQFSKNVATKGGDYWVSYIGLMLWGFSTLLFLPFGLIPQFEDFLISIQVLLTSSGVIITGTGLLSYFIRNTSENLGAQYEISQLLGSILSHDVRNYVGSLNESIDQAIASEQDREMWLELASEIITSMTDFVMDIRYITATVTRVEHNNAELRLSDILQEVSTRVAREYNLESGRIAIDLDEDALILSCKIVKELFWNIFDNAFKHGTQILTVRAYKKLKEGVIVEILDRAGGLPLEIQEFLNNSSSLSSPSAPGIGLGIILIRGLTLLCGIPMKIQDVLEDEQVVGSLIQLKFKYQDSVVVDE